MTRNGLQAARESAAQLDVVIAMVDDAQWEPPSACADWRVIDVIAHLAALTNRSILPRQTRRCRPIASATTISGSTSGVD